MEWLFTLSGLLRGSWEYTHLVYMFFVDLEKEYNAVPLWVLWGILEKKWVQESLLQAIWSLYEKNW